MPDRTELQGVSPIEAVEVEHLEKGEAVGLAIRCVLRALPLAIARETPSDSTREIVRSIERGWTVALLASMGGSEWEEEARRLGGDVQKSLQSEGSESNPMMPVVDALRSTLNAVVGEIHPSEAVEAASAKAVEIASGIQTDYGPDTSEILYVLSGRSDLDRLSRMGEVKTAPAR